MVDLAKRLGVDEFHYVATAYVAGRQTGTVYEQEQHPPSFNNAYEESKCKAEYLVRESGIPFTVYRPGIIVGRKGDGRIRKPLAFYRILEFLQQLKSRTARLTGVSPDGWVDMDINCRTVASEHIYFVPIDYVQAAIAALFQKGTSGVTYHVTGDHPVSAVQILRAVCRVFRIDGLSIGMERECQSAEEKMFTKFVGDLFPYFSSDIVFDQQNIRRDFAGLAAYDYGSADLEVMVRAYLADHYGSVAWIRDMLAREPDRDPRIGA
jgi:nucleoside-diphosphate-sugar epimerase